MDKFYRDATRIVQRGGTVRRSSDSEMAAPPTWIAERDGEKKIIRWWNNELYIKGSQFVEEDDPDFAKEYSRFGDAFTWDSPLHTNDDIVMIGVLPCWWLPAKKKLAEQLFIYRLSKIINGSIQFVLTRKQFEELAATDSKRKYERLVRKFIRNKRRQMARIDGLDFFGCYE